MSVTLRTALLSAALAASSMAVHSCETASHLLCENFETALVGDVPDPALWSLQLGEGSTIVVDDTHTAGGRHAVRIEVTQDRQWAYLQNTSLFPAAGQGFWGRLFFRIGAERPDNEGLVHWNLIEAMAEHDPIRMYRYGGISVPELDRNYFNWNHEMRPRPDGFSELSQDDHLDARVRAAMWHCVEWHFDVATNTSRFFWNGEEREALRISQQADGVPFEMLPFRALNVGFTLYQPILQDYVVWIDEIAVDETRIGCPT